MSEQRSVSTHMGREERERIMAERRARYPETVIPEEFRRAALRNRYPAPDPQPEPVPLDKPLTDQDLADIRQLAEGAVGDYYEDHWHVPAMRLLNEVTRLRQALEVIADTPNEYAAGVAVHLVDCAREALGKPTTTWVVAHDTTST